MTIVIDTLAETTISILLGAVTSLLKEKVDLTSNAKGDLVVLQRKLKRLQKALKVTDHKPFFSNQRDRDLEGELKDVFYDAQDIIEEYQTRIELHKREKHSVTSWNKVRKAWTALCSCLKEHVSASYRLGSEIKKINQRLNEIEKDRTMVELLRMTPKEGGEGPVCGEHDNPRETTHHVGVQQPIGREDDKNLIIEKLLSNNSTQSSMIEKDGVSIISIVGKGGIGKTTLARMVFKEAEEQFGKRRWWVCVSERPNRKDLVLQILREVCKGSKENLDGSLSYLCTQLQKELSKEKFLLVLDDVWELILWDEEVKGTLMRGAMKSKILITSRKKDVSDGMCASYMHELREFSFHQSWDLFLKEALREGQTEQDLVIHKVRDVAKRIVKKCGGLPLVIKTVGSMMRTKEMSREDWKFVEESEIWEWKMPAASSSSFEIGGNILSGLILSYDDLSPSLKSCFVYCCIYPKDYEIKRERLIMQWVAHGLIEEKESIDMEVTANQYIKDLIRRYLIEETEEGDLKLHDILHDLASYIGGKEYSHASATEHTRHLSLLGVHDADVHKCNASGAANKLRTILLSDSYSNLPLDYIAHLTNFKWLRVLSLTRCRIHELPNYIECFSLLKYLDLSFSDVRQLPSSISRLCNLQTFDLNYSEIEELPKEMGEVRNLRYLGLKHTEELKFIAEGLGKLTNLQTLKRFLVCNDKGSTRGCNIKELKDLNKLKGKLSIKGLGGGWVKVNDAKKACLKEKHELIGVELDFKVRDDDKVDGASGHRSLLEALEPPHGIESLAICDYEGDRPVWYLDTNYAELRTLRLQHCSSWATVVGIKSLEKLEINVCPTFCELPSMPLLKSLKIWCCDGLNMIGDLPALEWLVVERCGRVEKLADLPALKSLEVYRSNMVKTLANMPALESLEVGGCASLEQVVDDHMRALKKLRLSNLNMPALSSLACGFNRLKAPTNMPALESLEVIDCGSLEKLPHMPALKSLKVCGPNRLETLSNMPALESLEVKDCGSLEQLADMPALKTLEVYRSNRLETLANMPALEWLRVKDCGSLKQLAPKSLEVFTCGRIEQVVDDHMSALKSLELYNLNTMKQLPSRLPSLEELRISDLPNWEGWPAAGLGETTISSMSCLRVADFDDCPKMQTQGLIYALSKQEHDCQPQLQELIVWDCPSARVRWKLLKQQTNLIGLTLDRVALESTLLPPLPLEVSTFLPSLKVLTLIDTNIDELKWGKVPEWVWGLSKLETLALMGFTDDISLGGHWQCLPNLRYLRLFHFPNLESLVDVNNIIPQQNDKVATTCPTNAKEQIACLSKLENLVISSCPSLDLPQELMDRLEERLDIHR